MAVHQLSENIIVKITTSKGLSGYGEGIPREFVTGETMEESLAFLSHTLAPEVAGRKFPHPQVLWQELDNLQEKYPVERYPGAFCALETACLDAAGKTWNLSLTELLGGRVKDSVIYSAVLPMAEVTQLTHFLQRVKANRMQFVKLKVGEADDLQVLHLARKELGWEVDLRVDANAAWSPAEAIARLQDMQPFRLSAVEQPVSKDDRQGLKQVSQALAIPVIADESLCTLSDAQELIALEACSIFNLRLSKCGGLGNALKIKKLAESAGVLCQLGCQVGETSILAAAGRHFALATNSLVYVEGSFAPLLLSWDTCEPPVFFGLGGRAEPLPGPGLGIHVQEEVLDQLAAAHYEV